MRFLLSQDASLFLKYTWGAGTQIETAISIAYKRYIESCEIFKDDPFMKQAKKEKYKEEAKECLDLLTQGAIDFVHRQAVGFKGNDEELKIHLTKYINDLAGNFNSPLSDKANSVQLIKYLEEKVLQHVLLQIKAEAKKQEILAKWISKEEARYAGGKRCALFGRSKGQQFYGPVESRAHLALIPRKL